MSAPAGSNRILSERQQMAAHRLGQDVCVVAGPGSGKTSVLIERFAWLITEQSVPPNRLLAITFTEKAATEIKARMLARFAAHPYLREPIERAYVSTIHAFCARLLRENAVAAGIDPEFEVLDLSATTALLQDVADEVLESVFAGDPNRMRRFLQSLAVGTEREGQFVPDLAQSLIAIYQTLRIAGVEITGARLNAPDLTFEVARFRNALRTLADERPRTNTDNQRQTHAAVRDWALEFLDLPDKPTPDHFRLLKCSFNKGHMVKGSQARDLQDDLRGLSSRLHARLLIDYYSDERHLILESLQRIDELFRRRKRAISGLDFDDLEEQVISLLSSDEVLRSNVRGQFEFILMDELQDTNPLQWKLLSLIRRENNFFAVGDVNQSIFGFRHAEPELFLAYRKALESESLQIDELRDNYRSRACLLETVNSVFESAAGIEPHTLQPQRHFSAKHEACVEVIAALAEETPAAEQIEAQWVARRISELVGSLTLDDGRPARYKDVAVLTRSNNAATVLQNALDDQAVPSIVLGGLSLYDTREIRDLILLLTVIVNPRNEIALAGLLRSPLFGLSDEDLLRLSFFLPLSDAVEKEPPKGWQLIADLRAIRNLVSPDRLLRRALDFTGYESGLSSRGRGNIEKVLAVLRTKYAGKPAPLTHVLRELETAAPDAEAPPADFGDAVRLMTIHKSKGLEFPIVFLPFLHTDRGTGFPIVSYSHTYGLGVKWRDPHSGAGQGDSFYDANRQQSRNLQESEDNRLLYVAMTRAKEHMVLSWSVTKYARGGWAELLTSKLSVDTTQALNEAVDRNAAGIRVLTVDRRPSASTVRSSGAASSTPEITYLDVAGGPAPHDASASVTDISAFHQCPRRYYLGRYLRWPATTRQPHTNLDDDLPLDSGDLDASQLGQQVHALLAGQPIASPDAEASALADVFRASPLGRQSAKASRRWHEYDFVLELNELVMRGQIDLLYQSGRDLTLVDYKTDRVPYPVPGERLIPYELQIQLYALATEKALGRLPTQAFLHFLRRDLIVPVNLSPLALNTAREAVREFLAAQGSLTFPTRPAEHCRFCEFRAGLCPIAFPPTPE